MLLSCLSTELRAMSAGGWQGVVAGVGLMGLAGYLFVSAGDATLNRLNERKEDIVQKVLLREPALNKHEARQNMQEIVRLVAKTHLEGVEDSDWRLDRDEVESFFPRNPRRSRMLIPFDDAKDAKADPADIVHAMTTERPLALAHDVADGNLKRAIRMWRVRLTVQEVEAKCGILTSVEDWERCSILRKLV